MTEPLIKGVSDTAFMVARWRAMESERPDPLFRDPFAARLAGEHGSAIVASLPPGVAVGGWSIVIRTVIIDAFIEQAVAGGVDTIANLGAGLDARPYRMALPPGLRWIEIDYPHVLALKAERLAGERPTCRLERIPLDLADRPARRARFAELAAGSRRMLALTEGVIPYLTVEEVGTLADDLGAIHIEGWIVDYFSAEMLRYRRRTAMSRHMREVPFRFEPADYFRFFEQHGWKPREIRYLAEEGIRLGRPIPLPRRLKLLIRLRRWFAKSGARDRSRQLVGYVWMQPASVSG